MESIKANYTKSNLLTASKDAVSPARKYVTIRIRKNRIIHSYGRSLPSSMDDEVQPTRAGEGASRGYFVPLSVR